MAKEFNDEMIIRYLLSGNSDADVELCSEDDARKVETLYWNADPRFFEHVLTVEEDLFEAYAYGELSAEDRLLFEQKFLQKPANRERIRFLQSLRKWAKNSNM